MTIRPRAFYDMTEYSSIAGILKTLIRQDVVVPTLILLIALMASLIIPWFMLAAGYRINKSRYFLSMLPFMKAKDVYTGLSLIKGTVESSEPLTSYLTGAKCVWYNYYIQEQWRRKIKTRYKDRKGRERIKREVIYGWSPLFADEVSQPFYLQDDTGYVLVKPEGARVEPVTVLSRECGIDDPMYFELGPGVELPESNYRRRFVEEIVPLHAPVNILGTARERSDEISPEITQSDEHSTYIISTRRRRDYQRKLAWKYWRSQIMGFLILSFPLWFFSVVTGTGKHRPDDIPVSLILLILYVFIAAVLWRAIALRSIRRARKRARQAWAHLEGLLLERKMLVPELYRIASYYCHWDDIPQQDQMTICARLKSGTLSFDELLENNPALASGKIFMPLNRKLKNTEKRIEMARQSYDIYVDHFNRAIMRFPGSILHFLCHLRRMPKSDKINMIPFLPEINPVYFDSAKSEPITKV